MSTTRKKDIKFGKKDLLPQDEFNSENGKIRISLMVDLQVYEAFKERAMEEGDKYQVLMRKALREAILGNELKERLLRLERAVFKKQA
ncbi:MAG: hypothetical protein A2381_06190 [Bdellovibrionales bacterium RIFOXYB1_FULL_37_110]|nr:MAG: hypothetical protein A2417_05075 [Bdellovibrionales bacterium RIFOXYC1_FULL_37_79]OFZ59406.1 MAG: hypothetical protein A2381_06190 [Bdellovibrionales bacterium RIFOXYB1_FULL_37_110]OFZ61966.1 MAG: hypothetical protein A2577_18075 [Bdellovibrionales bacterium RIFOXYD1_FULL_36_51]